MTKIIIDSENKVRFFSIKELWFYRDLFLTLAYRDYKVRYAQTVLGLIWAFLQPLATLMIFVMIFGKAVKVDTGSVPYPIFAICGMSAWAYFSYVIQQSGSSIISSQEMVKKVYFPRLIIPLSKAVVGFIDYAIAFLFLLVLMLFYRFFPSPHLIYLPIFILLTVISSLSLGIWLSALTIRFRDFIHVVPFMIQFGLYATPVGYPASLVVDSLPEWAVFVYYLNPMAGIIEGFRWSVLGGEIISSYASLSIITSISLFISGLIYFRKVERIMADLV